MKFFHNTLMKMKNSLRSENFLVIMYSHCIKLSLTHPKTILNSNTDNPSPSAVQFQPGISLIFDFSYLIFFLIILLIIISWHCRFDIMKKKINKKFFLIKRNSPISMNTEPEGFNI